MGRFDPGLGRVGMDVASLIAKFVRGGRLQAGVPDKCEEERTNNPGSEDDQAFSPRER